jgi:hypothetical protein
MKMTSQKLLYEIKLVPYHTPCPIAVQDKTVLSRQYVYLLRARKNGTTTVLITFSRHYEIFFQLSGTDQEDWFFTSSANR